MSRGIPLITTVNQAGSKGSSEKRIACPPNSSARCGTRSNSRKTPATIVIGSPARKSQTRFIMLIPPAPHVSLDAYRHKPYNIFANEHFVLFHCNKRLGEYNG